MKKVVCLDQSYGADEESCLSSEKHGWVSESTETANNLVTSCKAKDLGYEADEESCPSSWLVIGERGE